MKFNKNGSSNCLSKTQCHFMAKTILPTTILLIFLLGTGLAISGEESGSQGDTVIPLQSWGTMREVLAQGKTEARVALSKVVNSNTVGIGALAGLTGEVTILDGVIHTSSVTSKNDLVLTAVEGKNSEDQGTLLAISDVSQWSGFPLPAVAGIEELESIIKKELAIQGFALDQPVPFKVEAVFSEISIHVLNNSCPVANPEGPEPWRGKFTAQNGFLVGIYAEGFGGQLTHHGSNSHIHAVIMDGKDVQSSGHVEACGLSLGSVLYLPEDYF